MQHPDEGTIHAWLDGCVPDAEARAIEAHVAACGQCASAVAEARGLMAASSRILAALDEVPGGVVPTGEAASGTRAGAGVSVSMSAHERRRRLGVYARIAAALAFVTAGGLTLARAGKQGIRPGDVRDDVPSTIASQATVPATTVAVASPAARPASARAKTAVAAKAPAVSETAAASAPTRVAQAQQVTRTQSEMTQNAAAVKNAPASAYAGKPSPTQRDMHAVAQAPQPRATIDAAAKRPVLTYDMVTLQGMGDSQAVQKPAASADRPASATSRASGAPAAPAAITGEKSAGSAIYAGGRRTAVADSTNTLREVRLLPGSVQFDSVRGVERRTYEVRPGVFVRLDVAPARGAPVADSAFTVGSESVLRWTEAGRQYVLRGPVTVAELRRMKESGAMR